MLNVSALDNTAYILRLTASDNELKLFWKTVLTAKLAFFNLMILRVGFFNAFDN